VHASRTILDTRVDATDYDATTRFILDRAASGEPGYVCAANVHMVMEARDHSTFRDVVNGACLVTADGMPLVFMLRRLGIKAASRVYGPDLMLRLCETAANEDVPIALFGGTPESLEELQTRFARRFPALRVVYAHAPPFRPLTDDEDATEVRRIVESGAKLLFVGLGCPKQENWMHLHASRIGAVMLGVGAAFDFHAGRVRQAPAWMQRLSLEWAFRFAMEPKRLWKRYLRHNPRFVWYAARQLLTRTKSGDSP